ncbi:Flavocytochrome c [Hortaea werneckii]|nr:Flavocytochrome c [Hortaea werneckii]
MSGVEVENVRSLAVEHEADRPKVLLLLLPHLARDVITVLQLVCEPLALAVQQQTTLATESLCSQELRLSSRVLRVDKTCRVDLHRLHVDAVRTNVHQHLVAVTSGVGTIGVCGVSASSQYNWALKSGLLPVERLFEALHQCVGDGHTRELGVVATVSTFLVISYPNRETRVRSRLKTSCSHSTAAADLYVSTLIRSGLAFSLADFSSSIDTGGGLGGVAAHEVWNVISNNHRETLYMLRSQLTVLIQQHDIAAGKVDGVSSAQAGHCIPVSSSPLLFGRLKRNLRPAPTTMTRGGMMGISRTEWNENRDGEERENGVVCVKGKTARGSGNKTSHT